MTDTAVPAGACAGRWRRWCCVCGENEGGRKKRICRAQTLFGSVRILRAVCAHTAAQCTRLGMGMCMRSYCGPRYSAMYARGMPPATPSAIIISATSLVTHSACLLSHDDQVQTPLRNKEDYSNIYGAISALSAD
jgi:hypothetical protein